MEIVFLTIFILMSFILLIFGMYLENVRGLLFVITGSLGMILLGLNIIMFGISRNYIISDALEIISTKSIWTNGFGFLLLVIGVGELFLIISEIISDEG